MEKKDNFKYKETYINLKKTWKYAKKNSKPLFGYLVCSIVLSVISAVIPIISAKVLLSLTGGKFKELVLVSSIVFAIEISRNLFRYFANRLGQVFFRETLVDVQLSIAKETINLESSVLDNKSSGTFIDRLNKDSSDIADIFNWLNGFVSDLLSNVGILVAVYIISGEMFLVFMIGIIILFIFKKIKMKKYFERDKKFRELSEKNTGLITELIRGIKDIKVLDSSEVFINKVLNKLRKSNQERYAMMAISVKYDFITGSIQDALAFVFIVMGIWFVNANLLTIPSFVVLYMYQGRVYNVLSIFAQVLEVTKRFNLSAGRVFEIIDGIDYKKEEFGKKHLKKIHGDFEFKNVTFSYKEKMPVINNLSFKVKANETVAFVGKSGGGKSTIFSLLTKLYTVNDGEVLIDGININDLDRKSIRSNISIITQTPYIFNFTIKENLSIVKENIKDKEIIEACKKACIHDYIMTLPDKYDTIVGEGGLTLSGGQRQRLAIARALIKNTEIILFDEATSALDNQTQNEIQIAINNMKNKHTILIIAHRLSTIINSDRIILIDDGKVLAEGTHKELLKNNNKYKTLYDSELLLENK